MVSRDETSSGLVALPRATASAVGNHESAQHKI